MFPHDSQFRFRRHLLALVCSACLFAFVGLAGANVLEGAEAAAIILFAIAFGCGSGWSFGVGALWIWFGTRYPVAVVAILRLMFYGFPLAALISVLRFAGGQLPESSDPLAWSTVTIQVPGFFGWAAGAKMAISSKLRALVA